MCSVLVQGQILANLHFSINRVRSDKVICFDNTTKMFFAAQKAITGWSFVGAAVLICHNTPLENQVRNSYRDNQTSNLVLHMLESGFWLEKKQKITITLIFAKLIKYLLSLKLQLQYASVNSLWYVAELQSLIKHDEEELAIKQQRVLLWGNKTSWPAFWASSYWPMFIVNRWKPRT